MIEHRLLASRPSKLVADASNFLHMIDIERDQAVFIPTKRNILSDASFVDGRSPIATGPIEVARLSELMRSSHPDPSPARFIFHVSFCGSTYLSRLIDVANHSLVLKEPNCLVDLANWKTAKAVSRASKDQIAPALQLARNVLQRPFGLGELVAVKPSSWVNNLLVDFTEQPETILPVFVTIGRGAFLRAVFRGGTERLAFTAKLAQHLAATIPDGDQFLQMALENSDFSLGRAANLAVVAHHIQMRMFDRALLRGGWSTEHLIDFDEITRSPFEAAKRASRVLRLGLEPGDIEGSVAKNAGRHAKAPMFRFSANQIESDDEQVLKCHGAIIEVALAWGELQFDRFTEDAAA